MSSVPTDVPAAHIVQDLPPSEPALQPLGAAVDPAWPSPTQISFAALGSSRTRPSSVRSVAGVSTAGSPYSSPIFLTALSFSIKLQLAPGAVSLLGQGLGSGGCSATYQLNSVSLFRPKSVKATQSMPNRPTSRDRGLPNHAGETYMELLGAIRTTLR